MGTGPKTNLSPFFRYAGGVIRGGPSIELRVARTIVAWLVLAGVTGAFAQSPSAARFASPNLTPAGVRALAANCAQCHGTDGHPAPGSVLPALAGRDAHELARALLDFKAGRVRATVMDQVAKGYSDAEIAALADYFAARGR
jgi:cytochrome c553